MTATNLPLGTVNVTPDKIFRVRVYPKLTSFNSTSGSQVVGTVAGGEKSAAEDIVMIVSGAKNQATAFR